MASAPQPSTDLPSRPTDTLRPRGALYAIDLLRFAAAMLVLLFHFFAGYSSPGHRLASRLIDQSLLPDVGRLYAGYGWIGVEIFFVISGYVIAISARGSRALPFARRRLLRLWPAALICASLTLACLWPFDPRPSHFEEYARSAMLWPWGEYIDGSYWTLGVESVFYALVALLLWISPWRNRIEALALILGTASLFYWNGLGAELALDLRDAQLLLLPHGCFFALGIFLHRWHAGHRGWWRAAAMLLMIGTGVQEILFISRATGIGMQIAYPRWIGPLIFFGGLAIIAFSPRLQPMLERHLPRAPVLLLGLATYPLYLIHQTIGLVLISALLKGGLAYVPAALITLVAITGAALLIASTAEPWLRALMSQLLPLSPPSRGPVPDTRQSASRRGG
ncbi:acyltransferase family protein [Novosphingopyxis sp. YJ-S2-01]|uniref:acyltransferase family protein n=1 Tax=Novosphingopyxis sp. YJ-S2-01 TaxID=2794021 RepID=UPI0018DE3706|nr:acyltransferase [Novosphingopyxis sp. YJ-S2-01]MBH9536335.1 acyltransferase [Novosphingopyxis sp. YJ-S2-01]